MNILQFKLDAQKHYQVAARHLLKKSVLGKMDLLKVEWRLLQLEIPVFDPDRRIEQYWRKILLMTGPNNELKFPNISKVKATFPIAHGNADYEIGFSQSKQQQQLNQARMKERFFNAKL